MGLLSLKGFPGTGSFRHGVHPPDNKSLSAESKVEVMETPDTLTLPLLQHLGVPCKPVVKAGQMVRYGEMIGKGEAFVSASLHSPVAGKIKKSIMVTLPNGRHLPAMSVQTQGEQVSPHKIWADMKSKDWPRDCISIYDPFTIVKIIHDSGIVGLGGAAFPTHVKVTPNDTRMIDTLMINGCECEPYLTCDYRLMKEAPRAIVAGALLTGRAVSAREIVICVEDNKPDAVKKLKEATEQTVIKIAVLKTKYPQGSEKQLIKAVIGLEIPLGGLPSDVGVAMSNVGTMATVARGVIKESPLTHRVISVSGRGIKHPKNLFVPIGISMGEVIDYCGGLTQDAARVVAGGPMMGFSFSNFSTPVTKGTSGITVLSHDEISNEKETACVRCGRCVDACPMNLVPTRLALAARYNNPSIARQYHIQACFECGCCTYVCPAKINLVQLIRTGKKLVASGAK
ncbi:MAG: electron transport complex subunit RsxC [Desulfobacter sp.]|nr:electron transport complex subunit RsxC [Desulfobacter sp.]WDP83866.1 MAG: electron transport complex subunit RsxC [Desulfobacter sp.]